MTNSGGLTELPGMLCPWVTPAWSSPIASVFHFSPQASYAFSTTALALGRWPCHLCHRERGGSLLFTPSALRAPVYPHFFPKLHPLSSRPGGGECQATIEVKSLYWSSWCLPSPLEYSSSISSCLLHLHILLFFAFPSSQKYTLSYFHLRHKNKSI